MSVILIPSDSQPYTLKLPKQIGKVIDMNVITPPLDKLPSLNKPADITNLHTWLKDILSTITPDALIVNLETLTLGGVIAARMVNDSEADVIERLKILEELHTTYPELKIYAHGVIARIPGNNPNEEKENVAKNYELLENYGVLKDKAARGDKTSKDELNKVSKSIPANVLNDYLNMRKRNNNIHLKAIDYLNSGIISYLALTLDNSKSYGFTALDRRTLERKLNDLNLWTKSDIYPGCDEVSSELLVKFALKKADIKTRPKAYIMYSSLMGPETKLLYEDRSLGEVINVHKRVLGFSETPIIDNADVLFFVNSAANKQAEASTQPNRMDVESSDRSLPEFVDKIYNAFSTWKPIVIIDVAYANGCDNKFMNTFAKKCDINRLFGFAGWKTAANSVGSGLAMGGVSLLQQNPVAKRDLILNRIANDWIYQSKLKPDLAKSLNCKYDEDFGLSKNEKAENQLKDMIIPEIEKLWKDKFEDKKKKNEINIKSLNFPSQRLSSPDIELNIRRKPAPKEEEKKDVPMPNEPILERSSRKPGKQGIEIDTETLEANSESLGANVSVEDDIKSVAKNEGDKPTGKSIFMAILEKVFLDSIKKIVNSTQIEDVPDYITKKDTGKTLWKNTHFIFMLDCSGSMKGTRWESVKIGYGTFLKKVKDMENILVSEIGRASFRERVSSPV